MKLSTELSKWRCDRPDEWKMDEFIRNAEKLEAERDALAAHVDKITPLARRCLWGAMVWNDHNFKNLKAYCIDEAQEAGVLTLDDANDLLETTAQHHLSAHDAEVAASGIDAAIDAAEDWCDMGYVSAAELLSYAAQLRAKAKP